MSEKKRFTIDVEGNNHENAFFLGDDFVCYEDDFDSILQVLNDLNEENIALKQSNKEAIDILREEFNFAGKQTEKFKDESVVVHAYDIIRYTLKRALDKLY